MKRTAECTAPTDWTSLPTELWTGPIFGALKTKPLLRTAPVCRRWCALAYASVRAVKSEMPRCAAYLAQFTNATRARLSRKDCEEGPPTYPLSFFLLALSPQCVTSIAIYSKDCHRTYTPSLLTRFTRLEHLALYEDRCMTDSILSRLTRLRTLTLWECERITPSLPLHAFRALERLTLRGPLLYDRFPSSELAQLTQLRALTYNPVSIGSSAYRSARETYAFLTGMTALTELNLSRRELTEPCRSESHHTSATANLDRALLAMPFLTNLDLAHNDAASSDTLARLTRLVTLDIFGRSDESRALPALTALRELAVRSNLACRAWEQALPQCLIY